MGHLYLHTFKSCLQPPSCSYYLSYLTYLKNYQGRNMNKYPLAYVLIYSFLISLSVLGPNSSFAAANFKIVPLKGTTLPTEVLLGSTVSAYYTVTNLTHSARNGYAVVGLPSNVHQSTFDFNLNNLCTKPINLAAQESCVLKLDINAAVKSNFALCRGTSCTTSSQALNVSLNSRHCDPTLGPMSLINDFEETVYNFQTDGCFTGASAAPSDFSDVPVRPFIVGDNRAVLWFASNSQGYFKTEGVPTNQGAQDILARMIRASTTGGQCIRWLVSPGQGDTNPIQSYNNELWMVVPYTIDGQTIYSLVHNEYHPCVPPSTGPNCTTSVQNEYGNLVAAHSLDAGNTFQLIQNSSVNNVPVIVAPYPYQNIHDNNQMTGIAGMFAQSNIIKWGDYYYILIEQDLNILNANAPLPGVCIYRTNNLADPRSWLGFDGVQYSVPLVPVYPSSLSNPERYLCHPVLPNFYRFSWSYNVVLNKFIIMGLDTNYHVTGESPIEAFVYTLANLDPQTGVLSSATNTGNSYTEYFLREITWFDKWQAMQNVYGQAYPSFLDPNSPQISDHFGPNLIPGDRNFEYSASSPYLYYTLLFPFNQNKGQDRNVVRQALKVENCIP